MRNTLIVLIAVLLIVPAVFAQGKIGVNVGYWSPSLEEINDGLRDLGATERFSGNVTFGADYSFYFNEQFDGKVEGFYWSQNITEEGGEATISVIPIMVSALYRIQNQGSKMEPYVGAGVGIGFVSWEIGGGGDVVDDTANPFLFQLLGGINYPSSDNMYFFAEAAYMIGSFNIKISDLSFNEDASLNGFIIRGGVRFAMN